MTATADAEGAAPVAPAAVVPGPGLTAVEAAAALTTYGPNSVPAPRRRGVAWRAARQLRDPMLLLLLAAAALTAWHGDLTDTSVVLVVVVLNTAVGVGQELRAERAVAALSDLAAPQARVRRDGRDLLVPSADVVPGDLLLLDAGDVVAADATVHEAQRLETDDSTLTGESLAVAKPPGGELFAGTTVTRGRGVAVVTRTGAASSLGRIAVLVSAARPGPTPLQQRLARLGRQFTVAALALSALVVVGGLLRGLALPELLLTATSLAVAAVPESLPAVLTLSLALGAHRMARHAAIARELRAVETLGSVTLLATDKTGTLTENRMVAEHAWTPGAEHVVDGQGYAPEGSVRSTARVGAGAAAPAGDPVGDGLSRLLRDAVLCNDATVEPDPDLAGAWRPVGDPTEAALVVLAGRGGLPADELRATWQRVAEVPFDSDRAWMLTSHRSADGDCLTVVKGAPDVLLPTLVGGIAPEDLEAARAWAAARAAEGARVLAVAEVPGPRPEATSLPPAMRLVGLVALTDPPRQDLGPVLAALDGAGIRLAVMTGDHPATAGAIARRVGLVGDDAVVLTGDDLAGAEGSPASDVAVYARVRPEHKLDLVRRWQEAGEVVAVTGDGVNDGPALRMADIGVAMGRGGTEVARQAADLVLTDDSLGTVVHAVEEGRRIHDNLRRYLRYALSGGLAEVQVMVLGPFVGFLLPLLPGQILWVNMLTHGLPGVALGAEPASPGTMTRPPVARDQSLVDRVMGLQIALLGTLIAAVTLVAAVVVRAGDDDWRTAVFLVLGFAQLGVALAVRPRGAARHNPFLAIAVLTAMALHASAVLLPPLQALLETEPLGRTTWLTCLALSAVPGTLTWLARRLSRVLRRHHAS
ncbi:MAG TPA: cation-transporting P-type ATPase [Actinomycetes bacterium]|nr:cation-transporting P-type ATPase [Actinomycetes bacterium]